jgi:replicative DNA helicase Mcm
MAKTGQEEDISQLVSDFEEFFEAAYKRQIYELVSSYPGKKSLNVDYALLEKYSSELADELIKTPDVIVKAAEEALGKIASPMPDTQFEAHVRFSGLPDHGLLIQDISSRDIETMVSVKGVITKRAEVLHRVKVALYRCGMCDETFKVLLTKKSSPPRICQSCKRPALKLDEDGSYFVDVQRAEVQDLLERIKGGAPAAHVQLWMEDDLVNSINPGDTVEICGIVRLRPPEKAKKTEGSPQIYTRYLDVIHIKGMLRDFEELEITPEDETRIKELARDPRVYARLIKSIAPGIYGHEETKEALALQLFGGTKGKSMPGGGEIRADIHILLIGDPGSAKTRLLQYASDLAPKGIYVSGKSVTGVGLTASAEKDELGDGGWTLKAGALVLASGGIAAVDEFDKIDDTERAAMHEVMESQSVSVAKAGIVAKFKAKCSILAAANPKHGRFDPNKLPGEQFDIPPTILSRFDLIFPILDIMDEEKDTKLAEHILSTHTLVTKERTDLETLDTDTIHAELLRKYIAHARRSMRPVLTDEAKGKIRDYYVQLRKRGKESGAVPITPRQIEGLVRLAEASAKVRLSDMVEAVDAERSIHLTDWVLNKIMMDRETGRIDADIIATGRPKSQVDKINTLMGITRAMQKEFDMVEISKIVDEAKNYNIEDATARKLIDELIYRGELYKVKHGFVKIVDQGEG